MLILVKLASPVCPQMCRSATSGSKTLYSFVIFRTLVESRTPFSVSFLVKLRARDWGPVSRKEVERGKVGWWQIVDRTIWCGDEC